ncbi:response regulator transcription factor [Streptomyces sp. x-80]|uniref:response regulator transcription factor n=1 Tax=Streptomyces sp. x-80 TaxID=2789282 RepID=UPI00397EABA0
MSVAQLSSVGPSNSSDACRVGREIGRWGEHSMMPSDANRITRVLVVDDQELIRQGITSLLNVAPDMEVVGYAGDGAEAVSQARTLRPDIVLMDIELPRLNGVEAAGRLLSMHPAPKVLMLTAFNSDEHILAALELGVSGFLLKQLTPDELRNSVRTAVSGGTALGPEVAALVASRLGRAYMGSPKVVARLQLLNKGELEVLKLIREGLPNGAIAVRLHMSEHSVKTYVSRILKKLSLDNRTQAAIVAYEAGLR